MAETRPSAAAPATASCGRRRTCSTRGSARSCGRSRCSAGRTTRRSSAPSTRPTSSRPRARSSILWVARMIMMGLEFAGDVPFDDVYVHSVILAPDGRRMSKSLGTGIDPRRGDRRARRGRAALRPDGDVLEPGRQVLDEARGAGPRPREQALERVAAGAAERGSTSSRRRGPRRSRTAGSSRACSALIADIDGAHRRVRVLTRRARSVRVLLERVLRLVPRDGEAAPLRGATRPRAATRPATCSSRRSRCCTR